MLAAEDAFRFEPVVFPAKQAKVPGGVISTESERHYMIYLYVPNRVTSASIRADEGASPAVPEKHVVADLPGDAPPGRIAAAFFSTAAGLLPTSVALTGPLSTIAAFAGLYVTVR